MSEQFVTIPVRDDAQEFHTFERGRTVLRALSGIGVSVQGQRVVDLGAGYGSLSLACLKAGAAEVVAVDIHQERLDAISARAAEQGISVQTRTANLLHPWGQASSADVAFLIGVVEYAGLWDASSEVADLQRTVFTTAFDALRPGGTLIFGSKNRLWPRYIAKDVHTGQPLINVIPRSVADKLSLRFAGRLYRHHIHSPRQWHALITSAGFGDVQTYVPYLSYQFPLEIVVRPSFADINRVRRMAMTSEERGVAWGRAGAVKAGIMATAGAAGIQMGSSMFAIAIKPESAT